MVITFSNAHAEGRELSYKLVLKLLSMLVVVFLLLLFPGLKNPVIALIGFVGVFLPCFVLSRQSRVVGAIFLLPLHRHDIHCLLGTAFVADPKTSATPVGVCRRIDRDRNTLIFGSAKSTTTNHET